MCTSKPRIMPPGRAPKGEHRRRDLGDVDGRDGRRVALCDATGGPLRGEDSFSGCDPRWETGGQRSPTARFRAATVRHAARIRSFSITGEREKVTRRAIAIAPERITARLTRRSPGRFWNHGSNGGGGGRWRGGASRWGERRCGERCWRAKGASVGRRGPAGLRLLWGGTGGLNHESSDLRG